MEASPRRAHPVLLRRDKRGGIRTDNRGLLFSPVTLAIVSPAVFNEQPSLKSICQLGVRGRNLLPPPHRCTQVVELCAQRWKCTRVNTAYRCGICPATATCAGRASVRVLARVSRNKLCKASKSHFYMKGAHTASHSTLCAR